MKRQRIELDGTVLLATIPRKKRIQAQNIEGRSFSNGDGDIFFSIEFTPPLSREEAHSTKLQFEYHAGTCKDGIHLRVAPKDEKENRMLGKRQFEVYETHANELDNRKKVKRVYLKASNNQLNGKDRTVILHPEVDMTRFIQSLVGDRFKGLDYYPPDPDLLRDLPSIRSEQVPQRTPLW